MNPQEPNDGTILKTVERPKRGRKSLTPEQKAENKAKRDALLKIGSDERDIEQNMSMRLSQTVEEGPYKSQAERWNAYRKILDLNAIRDQKGMKGISEAKIAKHIGCPYSEFEREIYSTAFQNHRIAKASMQIMGTLADIAPAVRITLLNLSEDIKNGKVSDPKKQREYIALVSNVMEKFGVQKIDISMADGQGDLNTDEAIAEGMRIVQELKGHENIVQWFTKVCTEPHGRRDKATIDTPVNTGGVLSDSTSNRPDQAVEAVRLRQTSNTEQKEISIDGGMQPVEQNGLADLGLRNESERNAPTL
jgi:hypothetical protein